jgi:LPS-assembly lipoprotein
MSWFKAKDFSESAPASFSALCAVVAIITASLFLLTSCGFEPMHGTHSNAPAAEAETVSTAMPDMEVASIPDRDGQYLRNLLMDRLYTRGRPANPPYTLTFSKLVKNIANLGIQKDATATRAQIQISTHMVLIDNNTGKAVLQRDLKTVGAYNLLDDQLSTLMSQQNITDSILQEMRSDAVTELSLYFRRLAASGTAGGMTGGTTTSPAPPAK